MEITTKAPPKRQETLGPTAPIHDWEVERATVLVELNESREKAERLEKQSENDRQTYERNTSSLLREVKLKENFMEKKLKDVEEQLMSQVLELQNKLEQEKALHQQEIQKLRLEQEVAMEAEDKKYHRRLASLQERLNAKDKEYADIMHKQSQSEDHSSIIESLQVQLAKEKEENDNLRELSHQKEYVSPSDDDEKTTETTDKADLESKLEEYQDQQKEYLQIIENLKTDLANANKQAQMHKKRLDQIESGHDAQIRELTEKFMSETQRSEMALQAQLQNLLSEHTDIIRELREQHETEKEVWQIQQTTIMEELRRDLNFEKEDAIRELNKDWKEKSEDLQASMSKDAMEIQAHWESKLEEAKSKSILQISRMQGEMEVVKDRLGKEIQKRKFTQSLLTETTEKFDELENKLKKLEQDYNHIMKKYTKSEKERVIIKNQYRTSYQLATDILTAISPNCNIDAYTDLSDILQTTVRHVSIWSIHDSDRQGSVYDLDGISSYGY